MFRHAGHHGWGRHVVCGSMVVLYARLLTFWQTVKQGLEQEWSWAAALKAVLTVCHFLQTKPSL